MKLSEIQSTKYIYFVAIKGYSNKFDSTQNHFKGEYIEYSRMVSCLFLSQRISLTESSSEGSKTRKQAANEVKETQN